MPADPAPARPIWPHVATAALGAWLATAAAIVAPHPPALVGSDIASGVLIVVLSGLACSPRFRWAPWALAGVGVWLMAAPLVFWAPTAAALRHRHPRRHPGIHPRRAGPWDARHPRPTGAGRAAGLGLQPFGLAPAGRHHRPGDPPVLRGPVHGRPPTRARPARLGPGIRGRYLPGAELGRVEGVPGVRRRTRGGDVPDRGPDRVSRRDTRGSGVKSP